MRSYEERVAAETAIYRECLDVHDLPAIFHYWSNRHIKPRLERFGFAGPDDMFQKYAVNQCRSSREFTRFASIGSGNCDLEVGIAAHLRATDCSSFVIDCFDLNPAMLERGRKLATSRGVADQVTFVEADVNQWSPAHEYDLVIANQSLHHIVELENVFAQVKNCLKPGGHFVMSDMIGRNGHQRWPEALEIVYEFWRKLPPSYRFNGRLQRYEEMFQDWDCSGVGFEGTRAQDILPLLVDRFHFQFFFGFANVIDPFVGPSFGDYFDPAAAWDRDFIDAVQKRDQAEIVAGRIKPTHMFAAVTTTNHGPVVCEEGLTPGFCVRDPAVISAAAEPKTAYDWDAWPHDRRRELEIACERLKKATEGTAREVKLEAELQERTDWALQLDRELNGLKANFAERTAWALQMEEELQGRCAEIVRLREENDELNAELERRTVWAQGLDRQVADVNRELEERTAWALQLNRKVEEQTGRLSELEDELKRLAWARAAARWLRKLW